jgi:hypothetical protein
METFLLGLPIAQYLTLCYPFEYVFALRQEVGLDSLPSLQPIVVYLIERHPLEIPGTGPVFRWLEFDNDFKHALAKLIGPFDPDHLTMLIDEMPAGPAWEKLIGGLLNEQVRTVVTHLAPLSSAQRQQLIGVCAQTGARLITPGDAGRNRPGKKATRST